MARARPSDLYRLPEHTRAAERATPPPPEPPHRRFPAWVGVALVLAAVLVVSGVIGTAAPPTTGDAPLVDIVREDQAIATLALYGSQAETIAELPRRRDIYANPGPRDAAGVAWRGLDDAQRALEAARNLVNPDPLVQAYVAHRDHAIVISAISQAGELADTIALLAAAHETLYNGEGSIPLQEAATRITAMVSGGNQPRPVADWGLALLQQMEERPSRSAADGARAATRRLWAQRVNALRPAADAELRVYLEGLPPVTVDGLRGHPVAGPALRLLEHEQRQVSGGEPSYET